MPAITYCVASTRFCKWVEDEGDARAILETELELYPKYSGLMLEKRTKYPNGEEEVELLFEQQLK